MRKYKIDFRVEENDRIHDMYSVLKLSPINKEVPEIAPGQFCQVEVKNSKTTFLRRPISVNFIDRENNLLWLLVRKAGAGSEALIEASEGDIINIIIPLGKSYSEPLNASENTLLVGGGVGVAPLLYFGKILNDKGYKFSFLLGAKSDKDLLQLDEFEKYGEVYLSTEDGSKGEKGFVTTHSVWNEKWDRIACCGPLPMMKAVASIAKSNNIQCEVSLENVMACGVGACLCCVEDTIEGNVCVCKEGPVFNIEQLKW